MHSNHASSKNWPGGRECRFQRDSSQEVKRLSGVRAHKCKLGLLVSRRCSFFPHIPLLGFYWLRWKTLGPAVALSLVRKALFWSSRTYLRQQPPTRNSTAFLDIWKLQTPSLHVNLLSVLASPILTTQPISPICKTFTQSNLLGGPFGHLFR